MKRTMLAAGTLLIAALPGLAAAQTPPPVKPPLRPVVPKPQAGKASVAVPSGLATRKLRYVARGSDVVVKGRVKPFVAGQIAGLEVSRKGKVVSRQRAAIKRGGRVRFTFKVRRRGHLGVRIRHLATPQQRAFASRVVKLKSVVLRAGAGRRGVGVLLLQRGLDKLGFAVPVSGYFDDGTARAVTAFRKTNGLGRDGYATPQVFSLVLRHRGAFKPRYRGKGRHVEFDWSRQVLALIKNGKPANVYHASSGTPATPTVFGTFRFYLKTPGTNAKGMVHSNYFIRGYAIHGYPSVPNYPASHGCIRVPIPNAWQINKQISIGQKIHVYV